jgi:two-component system NtrC family sensor kinase
MNDAVLNPELEAGFRKGVVMPPASGNRKPCILTVDDDQIIRTALAITIRKAGYDILQADSAEQAVKVLAESRPDLVLLDISMPGMSGIELARRLRAGTAIPFMFLSSHTDPDIVRQAAGVGAVGYLLKPLNVAQVIPAIEIGLARAHEIRWLRHQTVALGTPTLAEHGNHKGQGAGRKLSDAKWIDRYAELTDLGMRLIEIQQHFEHDHPPFPARQPGKAACEIEPSTAGLRTGIKALERYIDDLFRVLGAYAGTEAPLAVDEQARVALKQIKQDLNLFFFSADIDSLHEYAKERSNRVRDIVDKLRDHSAIDEAGKWQCIDLHACLDTALDQAYNETEQKPVVFKAYGDLPKIECLPKRIKRVFVNLIVNAVQATGGGNQGRIVIRTGLDRDRVWIEIRDNGCGILPENQKHIFTPFFTTKPAGKGRGIGLSLSCDIVHRHGGDISVNSKMGKGSTFRVVLPQRHANRKAGSSQTVL